MAFIDYLHRGLRRRVGDQSRCTTTGGTYDADDRQGRCKLLAARPRRSASAPDDQLVQQLQAITSSERQVGRRAHGRARLKRTGRSSRSSYDRISSTLLSSALRERRCSCSVSDLGAVGHRRCIGQLQADAVGWEPDVGSAEAISPGAARARTGSTECRRPVVVAETPVSEHRMGGTQLMRSATPRCVGSSSKPAEPMPHSCSRTPRRCSRAPSKCRARLTGHLLTGSVRVPRQVFDVASRALRSFGRDRPLTCR